MPQIKKGCASSLRYLINHVSSHINALQALSLNIPMHDKILNHLMLSTLGAEKHKVWEMHTVAHQDIPLTTEVTVNKM
jgi:hypothetical protein